MNGAVSAGHRESFHTTSWVAWLAAAIVPAFVLQNPLYSILILGSAWIVYTTLGRTSPVTSSWGGFLKLGLFFFVLTIPFNALSIHMGRIVLFRLPETWPIVGGAITLEAIIAGVVSGLTLLAILLVFSAFNSVVDHYQLLRAIPAFLFQAGVVLSIAITFVPQMMLSAKEIREAQRIRGHRFRGIRDLLPLILPLLASGLERAIQLAETMEARGFGTIATVPSRSRVIGAQAGTLAALLGLLAGLLLTAYFPAGRLGTLLVGLGAGSLLVIFWLQGRRARRTRYQRESWHMRDVVLTAASVLVVGVVLAARRLVPGSLVYTPFPPALLLPPFNPVVGGALLLLALPVLLVPGRERMRPQEREYGG